MDEEQKVKEQPTKKKKNFIPEREGESGKFQGLFPREQLLARYSRAPIYKPIVDYIKENTEDVFECLTVRTLIKEFYANILQRKIGIDSLRSYASAYERYLDDIGYIVRDKNKGICKKQNVLTTKRIGDDILQVAKENEWMEIAVPPVSYTHLTLPTN